MALRVGGLSSMGLGAGAWLARRNPLLAAGAAVGALATQKIQTVGRERSMRDGSEWLPARGDLKRTYDGAFSPLKLAQRRLGGINLELPSESHISDGLLISVEDSLAQLLDSDLMEQAQRAARLPWRLVVDLPVYAFGLWILARAVIGFGAGEYVGMDFLVNAALLAGAWLFVARYATRLLLRRRANALLESIKGNLQSKARDTLEADLEFSLEAVQSKLNGLSRWGRLHAAWRDRILHPERMGTSNLDPDD